MPGTVVRDALATNLLSGLTLNGAGTVNGTAHEIGWAGRVQFVATTGTVTGTTPTLVIEIQGCETSDFSTADVLTLATISFGDEDAVAHEAVTEVNSKFVRAVATKGGTTPNYDGTTLYPVPYRDRVTRGVRPSSEALV